MTDTSRDTQNVAQQPYENGELASDQAIENAALAGAAAVQRLVAERNELRNRLASQQSELSTLRSVNEDLRRRLYAIHQHYVEMAKRVVGDLEQVDGTIREVAQEAFDSSPKWEDKKRPASLAQRLADADAPDRAHGPNGAAQSPS
jgi:hypothetical protein